ncbi:MAG TPA: hypothetical protein VGF97_16990 [Rhizomicrobium sp.]|jgi:F0F1-type ATP synthase membrane subunit c/vacuolar-type H+-ATPase subunit K
MRQAQFAEIQRRNAGGEKLLFSAVFIGAVIVVTSALYAVDMATVRALLALP